MCFRWPSRWTTSGQWRSVADIAIMFDVIAGFDPGDPTSLREPAPHTVDTLRRSVEGLWVGIDRDYACTGVDRGQASTIEKALNVLTSQGVRVVDVRMPDLNGITDAWFRIVSAEALKARAAHYPSRASEYGRFFRDFLASASQVTEAQVAKARHRRTEFTVQFTRLLESVDAIICPAGDVPAPRVTRELLVGPKAALDTYWTSRAAAYDPPLKDTGLFPMPADLAGTPAICVPSGFSPDGLPYSIQFVGRRLSEPTLCRSAHAYEQATARQARHPNV